MGHARALLTLAAPAALALAKEAVAEGWSVREVERRAQLLAKGQLPAKKAAKPGARKIDADIASLERELSEKLGAKVAVQHGRGGRGKLVIAYHGLESLEGILERLRG
jgi:ParB family chromosome partitioning protein